MLRRHRLERRQAEGGIPVGKEWIDGLGGGLRSGHARYLITNERIGEQDSGLDPVAGLGLIAAIAQEAPVAQRRRIVWLNVITVISAAILISAEVFGAAVMVQFVRNAHHIEPFTK